MTETRRDLRQSSAQSTAVASDWRAPLSNSGRDLTARWAKPCRAVFELLAERSPRDLVALVKSGTLRPVDLTFAAETLGATREPEAPGVLKELVLSAHASPVVKEGALYGLCHLGSEELPGILRVLSQSDSKGLRAVALRLPAVSVAPCWAVDEYHRARHDVAGAYHLAYEAGMHYLLSVREPAP